MLIAIFSGSSKQTGQLFARQFATSQIIKKEEENYINRLIERKKIYDEQDQINQKNEKRDPWEKYKNRSRVRNSEGFSKESRSSSQKFAEDVDAEEKYQIPINKEGGAVPGEEIAVKKTWKQKLQEKRDKIQTKHGKLVDSDLELHYRNKRVNEMKVYGRNACLSLFERRNDDIIKCLILEELLLDKRFKPLFKYMAEKKLTYRATDEVELRAFSDSIHHEGIVMVTKRPEVSDVDQTIEMIISKYQEYAKNKRRSAIEKIKNDRYAVLDENEDEIQREELDVAKEEVEPTSVTNTQYWDYQNIAMLENVQNPHNLGALVRVLAFFGVKLAFVANMDAFKELKSK